MPRSVTRLLDANANRAREAMRVMEDAARFLLDDATLSKSLKQLRHDFAAALAMLPTVIAQRDTPGDVGTGHTTKSESRRGSSRDVAVAAGKRLSEALRCLEEFGKLHSPAFAAAMKQLRYRGYTLEQRLAARLTVPPQWRLCLILTQSLCTERDGFEVARRCVDAGADCVQLREKNLDGGELLDRTARLVELCGERASVIVNDRPDVALLAGAAGVHLGQHDLPIERVRAWVGPSLWIGSSTHNLTEARRALAAGADYCGVGAIFPTATKARRPSGLKYLRQFLAAHPGTPHLAIGGITPANIHEVAAAGARGIAVSSILCNAKNPGQITRQLLRGFSHEDAKGAKGTKKKQI